MGYPDNTVIFETTKWKYIFNVLIMWQKLFPIPKVKLIYIILYIYIYLHKSML